MTPRPNNQEQLCLDLFGETPVPGGCSYETAVAPIGKGKSYCVAWGRWTNCREVGHCVWDAMGRPAPSSDDE